MSKLGVLLLLGLACLLSLSEAKVFTRCSLARELRKQGLSEKTLPDWVCLVEAESSMDTSKKGGPNGNGSYDHGLFQINDKYWCSVGQKGKDCNVSCEDLRKDDITQSVTCAKKVYARHGFSAWYGWKNKCKDQTLPDLSKC